MTNDRGKELVRKRLDEVMPIMQKVAMGDFSENILLPEKEDEFTAHFIALNFMIDDLRDIMEENKKQSEVLSKLNKNLENEVSKRTGELEKKMYELEKFNRLAVDRELKMIELKKEIKILKERIDEAAK